MTPLIALFFARPATLQLNGLFSDGMVLQRNIADPVFGSAIPGAFVQVEVAGQRAGATADANGRWLTRLKPMKAGGPYVIKVSSGGETISVRDVLVGEVWVCSGQSNMELPEAVVDDFGQARAEARPDVRMFTVQKATAEGPVAEVKGGWEAASPLTVGRFSAVGLSFARELNRRLKVPVGMIHTSWGGTPAEAWTSAEALQASATLRPMIASYQVDLQNFPAAMAKYQEAMREYTEGRTGKENEGYMRGWAQPEFDDSSWQSVPVATTIEKATGTDYDGSFWYRSAVDVPAEWVGKELRLELGPIDDYDSTYFDGVKVGKTDATVDDAYAQPRAYRVSPGIVRAGRNVVAIRVFDGSGPGGMTGAPEAIRLGLADGSAWIPLNGVWKIATERRLDPTAPRPRRPNGPGNPNVPTTLYNAMIAPLIPYGIKGAIWYQGESNAGRAYQYRELFPTMIRDWRARWQQGTFPFYFVQLANYMARQPEPGPSAWAELREAQTMTTKLPNTGQAVIIDIGEAGDIHPKNKREVGRRLSLIALAKDYGQPVVYGSPEYRSMRVVGAEVRIEFANGSLTTTDNGAPRGFAIAGADRKFVWAEARIDGSTVIVSSKAVPNPVAVRYGWADNPDVNLVNRAGLPANPFRTDDWKGVTAGSQ